MNEAEQPAIASYKNKQINGLPAIFSRIRSAINQKLTNAFEYSACAARSKPAKYYSVVANTSVPQGLLSHSHLGLTEHPDYIHALSDTILLF
jgi:hypothetical protein